MITPSQLERVAKCPRSETVPHVQRESGYSAAGVAAHRFLADVRELGRAAALRRVEDPEQLAVLEALELDNPRLPSLDPSAYTAELAFALDVRAGSARVLGKGLSRAEAAALARPGEMVGIADLSARADKTGVILDLKFGHGRVPRAAVNLQTDTYLLMEVLALGLEDGVQGIVRVFDGDDVWTETVQRDALELDDHLQRLRGIVAEVERVRALPDAERPPFVEGSWCTYCPAFSHCPAKRALLAAVLADPEAALPAPMDGELDRATLGQGWRQLRRAKQAIERLEALYKTMAEISPIPLGDGEVLGERVTESVGLVGWRAAKALAERGEVGAAIAEAARSEMTKASLERAVKEKYMPTVEPDPKTGKKPAFAPLFRDLMKWLEEQGATRVSLVRRICEFTPKAQEPAP